MGKACRRKVFGGSLEVDDRQNQMEELLKKFHD